MLALESVVFYEDVKALALPDLVRVAKTLGIGREGRNNKDSLAVAVWLQIKKDAKARAKGLSVVRDRILSGKTSVSWFRFDLVVDGPLFGLQAFRQRNRTLFCKVQSYDAKDLVGPTAIAAVPVGDGYVVRFACPDGEEAVMRGDTVEYNYEVEYASALVVPDTGLLEVRKEPRLAQHIATQLAYLAGCTRPIAKADVAPRTKSASGAVTALNIEEIARKLNGQIIDARAIPDKPMDVTNKQTEGVFRILAALNQYLEDQDIGAVKIQLDQFINDIAGMEAVPFTSYLLAGLTKLGLQVPAGKKIWDLQEHPLYQYLRKAIHPTGGYIQFRIDDDDNAPAETVKIGLSTNSVFFMNPATTDAVIQHVRNALL